MQRVVRASFEMREGLSANFQDICHPCQCYFLTQTCFKAKLSHIDKYSLHSDLINAYLLLLLLSMQVCTALIKTGQREYRAKILLIMSTRTKSIDTLKIHGLLLPTIRNKC
jgi:hypothetical protein